MRSCSTEPPICRARIEPTVRYNLTDDHIPLLDRGVHAIDVIDFDFPPWHTVDDTPDKVSARSLGIVGDVAVQLVM